MSLGQIIAESLMIAKLAIASPDTAVVARTTTIDADTTKTEQVAQIKKQDNSLVANPYKITLETGVSENLSDIGKIVNYQKLEINNKNVEVRFDFKGNAKDVFRVGINLPNNAGVAFYNVGDFNGQDVVYWEAWKNFKLTDNLKLLVDGGTGASSGSTPEYFLFTKVKGEKFFVAAAYDNNATKLHDVKNSSFVATGIDLGKTYVGLGRHSNGNLVAVSGIKELKNFGALGFGIYNPSNKTWSFKAQGATENIDNKFFSQQTMDFVVGYFALPNFFPTHFAPQNTRGKYSFKVEGAGSPGKTDIEMKAGFTNNILPLAAGIDVYNAEGKTQTGVVVEACRPFKFDNGINGYVEAKYNARTNAITAYLVFKHNQK